MTITPWSTGRPLVCDATCQDTFAASYRIQATSGAGKVAELAEERKDSKYKNLWPGIHLHPNSLQDF